jgi:hypothetical protein
MEEISWGIAGELRENWVKIRRTSERIFPSFILPSHFSLHQTHLQASRSDGVGGRPERLNRKVEQFYLANLWTIKDPFD